MRNILAILLVLGMLTMAVPSVMAQSEAENTAATTEEMAPVAEPVAAQAEEITGEVVSVSTEGLSLVLRYVADQELQTQKITTVSFTDTTEIKKADSPIKFADLKAGDTITVKYTTDDGLQKKAVSAIVK